MATYQAYLQCPTTEVDKNNNYMKEGTYAGIVVDASDKADVDSLTSGLDDLGGPLRMPTLYLDREVSNIILPQNVSILANKL